MLNQWPRDATLPAFLVISLLWTGEDGRADVFDYLAETRTEVSIRGHFEDVNDSSLPNADGATLRTRIKFETAEARFTQLTLELENTTTLTSKDFSNGVRDRGTTVIADPDTTEINQALLRFTGVPRTIIQLGRQTISLDNERFVGTVDFRQNQQTYDALSILTKPASDWSVYYAHIEAVNTFLGRKATNGRQRHDSDLLNIQYQLNDNTSVGAYHYAIENESLVSNQHKTSGIRFTASWPLQHLAPGVKLEYAHQTPDFGSSTDYLMMEAAIKISWLQLLAGQESLGGRNNTGFQTPLATLHKFNGFTDQFLLTPGVGLEDRYATLRFTLGPGRIELTAHEFAAEDGGFDLGKEHSVGAWYRLGERGSLAIKWARFDGKANRTDIRKYWLQLGYEF